MCSKMFRLCESFVLWVKKEGIVVSDVVRRLLNDDGRGLNSGFCFSHKCFYGICRTHDAIVQCFASQKDQKVVLP